MSREVCPNGRVCPIRVLCLFPHAQSLYVTDATHGWSHEAANLNPSRQCIFVIYSLQESRQCLSRFRFADHTVYSASTMWMIIVSCETNATKANKQHFGGDNCLKDVASNTSLDHPPFCFQIAGLLNLQMFYVFWLHTVSGFTFRFIFHIVVALFSRVQTSLCSHLWPIQSPHMPVPLN